MNILIAGGTGMIGTKMIMQFLKQGHAVSLLSRHSAPFNTHGAAIFIWDPYTDKFPADALKNTDVIINLCGAGIVDKRWTPARKKELIDSRVKPLQCIYSTLKRFPHKVRHVLSVSGIGYYGNSGLDLVTEDSPPVGDDFLVACCQQWEQAAYRLKDVCERISVMRVGVALDKSGGAYPKLVNPIRWGVMPLLAGGKAMYSWIHIDDVSGIAAHILTKGLTGTFNTVAPNPIPLSVLLKTFAHLSGKPCLPVFVPALGLRILLGEMDTTILNSNNVSAAKIVSEGYLHKFPTIDSAIRNIEDAT